jgi:SynChlorMet cassette protein ScmD
MTGARKAFANPVVVLREEFDDWAVLYNPDTAAASGINPVGVAIFKLLDGRHTLEQIVEAVRGEFSGAPEGIEGEVCAFVEGLVAKGYAGYEAGFESGAGAPAR